MGREPVPADLTPVALIEQQYDDAAPVYDEATSGPTDLAENLVVGRLLRHLRSRTPDPFVLDLGCGTGLCVDLTDAYDDEYLGYDLSEGMIRQAMAKYPTHDFQQGDMTDVIWEVDRSGWGLIASTFGSPSHVHPLRWPLFWQGIERALAPSGFAFLMYEQGERIGDNVTDAPIYRVGESALRQCVKSCPDLEVISITGLTWGRRKPTDSRQSVRKEFLRLTMERALRLLPVPSADWMLVTLQKAG